MTVAAIPQERRQSHISCFAFPWGPNRQQQAGISGQRSFAVSADASLDGSRMPSLTRNLDSDDHFNFWNNAFHWSEGQLVPLRYRQATCPTKRSSLQGYPRGFSAARREAINQAQL